MWSLDDGVPPFDALTYEDEVTARAALPPPPNYANVVGVMLARRATLTGNASRVPLRRADTFVRTAATLTCLHAAAMTVESASPLLLIGPPGCGKSSIAAKLAEATGNTDVVELYMDEYVDAKALLGAYICSSTPGEYHWQPGPLAQVRATPTHVRPAHRPCTHRHSLTPLDPSGCQEGLVGATGQPPARARRGLRAAWPTADDTTSAQCAARRDHPCAPQLPHHRHPPDQHRAGRRLRACVGRQLDACASAKCTTVRPD